MSRKFIIIWLTFWFAFAIIGCNVVSAHAAVTTGPVRPLRPSELSAVQHWIKLSHVPTAPNVTLHRGECPTAVACANTDYIDRKWVVSTGSVWIAGYMTHDRFAVMHELGHVWDTETLTDSQRRGFIRLLHMDGEWEHDARYDPGTTPPEERFADAYAMCSIHRTWPGTWWHWRHKLRDGTVVGGGDPTPYDYRANRRKFNLMCGAIRRTVTAHTADVGPWSPYPSHAQVELARANTRIRTVNKCYSEQLYRIINGHRVRVGTCFDPQVLFCARGRSPRRVVCPAIFHIRTRHGVYVWSKVFVWRVLPPVFGFLFPREVGGPWFHKFYGTP